MNRKEIEEFASMKTDIEHIKETNERILDRLDCLDSKFASKWVERAIIAMFLSLSGAIIGAVVYLI